jgi:hypothetical protein
VRPAAGTHAEEAEVQKEAGQEKRRGREEEEEEVQAQKEEGLIAAP